MSAESISLTIVDYGQSAGLIVNENSDDVRLEISEQAVQVVLTVSEAGGGAEVSPDEGNQLVRRTSGLYVAPTSWGANHW